RVVAADDIVPATHLAHAASDSPPVPLVRERHDLSVHVEAHSVRAAVDAVSVPDAGYVDPLAREARDRIADVVVDRRARPDDCRVCLVSAEEDREVEPRVARVNAILHLEIHVARAAELVATGEDPVWVVLERLRVLLLPVPGLDRTVLRVEDRLPQQRRVHSRLREVRPAADHRRLAAGPIDKNKLAAAVNRAAASEVWRPL